MVKKEEVDLEIEEQEIVFTGAKKLLEDGDGLAQSGADFDAPSKTARRSQVRPNDQ